MLAAPQTEKARITVALGSGMTVGRRVNCKLLIKANEVVTAKVAVPSRAVTIIFSEIGPPFLDSNIVSNVVIGSLPALMSIRPLEPPSAWEKMYETIPVWFSVS